MSLEMYTETPITRPRKKYTCELCATEIDGPHIKHKGCMDGDFFSYRTHESCSKIMHGLCLKCPDRKHCDYDFRVCFQERHDN